MTDCEVALELLKLALSKCPDAKSTALKKDSLLQLYRECLAVVKGKEE